MALETAEIITSPYAIYVAKVGTAFPKLNEETNSEYHFTGANSGWTLLGKKGIYNYGEGGVSVAHGQTIATFTPAGSTTPRKEWRTEETMTVSVEIADLSPETYAQIMDNAKVEETVTGAGKPATYGLQLKRGFTAHPFALLARGASPLATTPEHSGEVAEYPNAQYQCYCAYQTGTPTLKLAAKGGPALLACTFSVAEGEPGKWAEFIAQGPGAG